MAHHEDAETPPPHGRHAIRQFERAHDWRARGSAPIACHAVHQHVRTPGRLRKKGPESSAMSIVHLGIVVAFVAGLLSFLSPCVFPLVPGYLSYIAGATVSEARCAGATRWRVTAHAFCFVAGFALIFVMLGAIASA